MRVHRTTESRSILKRERKSLLKSSVENIQAAQFMCCLASLDNDAGLIAYYDDIYCLFQNRPGEFVESDHFLMVFLLGQIRSRKAETPYFIDLHGANRAVHRHKGSVSRAESGFRSGPPLLPLPQQVCKSLPVRWCH